MLFLEAGNRFRGRGTDLVERNERTPSDMKDAA
jgi:hypothetical protein